MPTKPATLCHCGNRAQPGSNRCPTHEAEHQAKRNAKRNASRTHYHGDWPAISAAARAAWVEANGWLCPGWQRDPHPSRDLTADHVNPRSLDQGVGILCRSCNARKGETPAA